MTRRIKIKDCLWLRSPNLEQQGAFRPIIRALDQRGAKVLRLENFRDSQQLNDVRRKLRATNDHVLVYGLLGSELRALQPVFAERGNFSMIFIDWWNSPTWYNQHAEYLFFPMYNGIAVRSGKAVFAPGVSPQVITLPERWVPYQIACSLLRLPFYAVAPVLEIMKARERASESVDPTRLIFFPFAMDEEDVPLRSAAIKYDVTNMGSTVGTWLMRDAFAPARWNFANLYRDRQRLIDLLLCHEHAPFSIRDRRSNYRFMPWNEMCQIIRESRLAICTGGLHEASISKYLEYTCLGTPMLGATLPFEYPWLEQVVFPIDGLRIKPDDVKGRVLEALDAAPQLRENCLNLRDRLLKLYNIHELLEMAQEQIDGAPIRAGYLKSSDLPESKDKARALF